MSCELWMKYLPSSALQDTGGNICCEEAAKERRTGSQQTSRKVSTFTTLTV